MHTHVTLKSNFVDFVVRGQGEHTLLEFLKAQRKGDGFDGILGLSYKYGDEIIDNPPRPLVSPDELPERLPYHKIEPQYYLHSSFLGKRTAAHHTSMGCPFSCNFCGVISVFGSREKIASPARTERALHYLKTEFGVDSIQFFDNNFFLGENHASELCERIRPLGLKWWCEARIDILLRYSDATWRKIRDAGCKMIYSGAESGSEQSLREMNKKLTREQIIELTYRAKEYDIIPEFSFMFGNPRDPLGDALATIDLIYQLKEIHPRCEIIVYHFTPTPQRRGSYGNIAEQNPYPETLEEWATPQWIRFASHHNPTVPWLRADLLSWLRNFETVIQCRWPTIQDYRLTPMTRRLLQALADWRYRSRFFHFPIELKIAKRAVTLRNPRAESL
ncbi:MAG: B12-binding domain-containing radical SAM protein [bacterium]